MDSIQNPLFYSCDIETLGTDTLSPIIEIGITAAYVNAENGGIDLKTASGLVSIDTSLWSDPEVLQTVRYHLKNPSGVCLVSQAIQHSLHVPDDTLANVWNELLGDVGAKRPPSNPEKQPDDRTPWYFRGPQFDAKMLEVQLLEYGVGAPWRYSCVRCQRTLDLTNPNPSTPSDVEHRAGIDARAQAERIVECMISMHGDAIKDWLL